MNKYKRSRTFFNAMHIAKLVELHRQIIVPLRSLEGVEARTLKEVAWRKVTDEMNIHFKRQWQEFQCKKKYYRIFNKEKQNCLKNGFDPKLVDDLQQEIENRIYQSFGRNNSYNSLTPTSEASNLNRQNNRYNYQQQSKRRKEVPTGIQQYDFEPFNTVDSKRNKLSNRQKFNNSMPPIAKKRRHLREILTHVNTPFVVEDDKASTSLSDSDIVISDDEEHLISEANNKIDQSTSCDGVSIVSSNNANKDKMNLDNIADVNGDVTIIEDAELDDMAFPPLPTSEIELKRQIAEIQMMRKRNQIKIKKADQQLALLSKEQTLIETRIRHIKAKVEAAMLEKINIVSAFS